MPRKYTLNEAAFDELTPATAYCLGFIAADGSIEANCNGVPYRCRIAVHPRDVDVLHYIRESVGSHAPIATRKNRDIVYLSLCSVRLATAIVERWGLVPNKSHHGFDFPLLSRADQSHFVRGCFDGDGCAHRYRRGGRRLNSLSLQFLGPQRFLAGLVECAGDAAGVKRVQSSYKDGTYCVRWSAYDDVSRLYAWMYSDAAFCLERKRAKFTEFFADNPTPPRERAQKRKQHNSPRLTDDVVRWLRRLPRERGVATAAAEMLGVPIGVVCSAMRGDTFKRVQ